MTSKLAPVLNMVLSKLSGAPQEAIYTALCATMEEFGQPVDAAWDKSFTDAARQVSRKQSYTFR